MLSKKKDRDAQACPRTFNRGGGIYFRPFRAQAGHSTGKGATDNTCWGLKAQNSRVPRSLACQSRTTGAAAGARECTGRGVVLESNMHGA